MLESGWLGQGAVTLEFEKRLSGMLGRRQVVAVNTGTSALHLALEALGIGPGDEVVVPSLTFCASAQAITATGATPVFCEVRAEDICTDTADMVRRITSRTKALMPTHYAGNMCEMDKLLAVARERGIRVVEDAAHAFGSNSKGRQAGSFGDITCFSFDPIKNITCGEGGAVVTNDAALAGLMRRKRFVGIDQDTWHRTASPNQRSYTVNTQGYRYHLSNVNAAIGLAQLRKMDGFRERKQVVVRRYNDSFKTLKGAQLLTWNLEEAFPFAYVLRVPAEQRDGLCERLSDRGMATGVHYIPNHLQPYFENFSQSLPVTEQVYREILTLPLFVDMTDAEVELIINTVGEFLA